MKVYLIKKFETNTCGMYAWEPWKIVNDYDSALREIKNDVIDPREQLNIDYSTNPKGLLNVKKFIPKHIIFANRSNKDDLAPFDWPLFTVIH